jgi:TRAP-type C4-dicarboxylate transport system substrate-binding protein
MSVARLLIIVGILGLAWARPAAAESHEFRLATLAPSGSPWMEFLEKAGDEIGKQTAGRVTVKYYPGGQQGDERDFVRKIKLGQLDGAALTAIGLAMIEPSILVLELPMLFDTVEEVDYVGDKMWPYFQAKFANKGFRLADRGEVGWIYFFSKTKVTSLEELRKQKLWTLGDDTLGSTFVDKLELDGVPLSVPEVDAGLTSGKINACLSSPLGAVALQWYTKLRYMSAQPMVYGLGATVMSLDAQKRVSAADVKTIESIAKRSGKKARATIRKANEDSRKLLLRNGISIVEIPRPMMDQMTAVAAEVRTQLTGTLFSKDELDMVLKYRDEYRAKHPAKAK